MTIAKLISYCIVAAMTVVILWAQSQVSIFDSPIPQLPWGIVSLVDLYAGFTLFGLWIAYKEPPFKTFLWVIGLILLGNLTTAVYVVYSISKSNGDIAKFFLGEKS